MLYVIAAYQCLSSMMTCLEQLPSSVVQNGYVSLPRLQMVFLFLVQLV